MKQLTEEEALTLIDTINEEKFEYETVRPHNKGEIRRSNFMNKASFKKMLSKAIEAQHQPGGDIELKVPSIKKLLIIHHDGNCWLE